MGKEEEYRQELISHLKANNITSSGTENIKQLEKTLKQVQERKYGR